MCLIFLDKDKFDLKDQVAFLPHFSGDVVAALVKVWQKMWKFKHLGNALVVAASEFGPGIMHVCLANK